MTIENKRKELEALFIDYVDDETSMSAEFKEALTKDPELKASFDAYREVVSIEQEVAGQTVSLSKDFSDKLMATIAHEGTSSNSFIARISSMFSFKTQKDLWQPLAVCCVVVLCIALVYEQGDLKQISNKDLTKETTPKVVKKMREEQTYKAPVTATKKTDKEYKNEKADQKLVENVATKIEKISEGTASTSTTKNNEAVNSIPAQKPKGDTSIAGDHPGNVVANTRTETDTPSPKLVEPHPKIDSAGASVQPLKGNDIVRPNSAAITQAERLSEEKKPSTIEGTSLPRLGAMISDKKYKELKPIETEIEWKKSDLAFSSKKSSKSKAKKFRAQSNAKGASIAADMATAGRAVTRRGVPPRRARGPIGSQNTNSLAFKRILPTDDVMAPIPAPSREEYGEYTPNSRTLVKHKPVSTFSIDVDTGSYTNARRYLNQGQLPPSNAVRAEEFINYFTYDYPSQSEKPFGLTYEIAPSALEPQRYLLRLGIRAQDAVVKENSWNLVFLVDVSGSMNSHNKLPLVKRALRLLVNQMRSGDKIGLVTYASSSTVALQPTGRENKHMILHAIENLRAGGGTHGEDGIRNAYQLARSVYNPNGVNRVIIATDGDFNVGVSNHAQLINLIEEKRKNGISLTTIGVGSGNIREHLMEQLANKGNGNYFYLDSFKEARKVFETDLTGTIETVAKDVKLQLEFNPEHVREYRLLGYENRMLKKEDFKNDKVDAGEIGSNHTVTALYEIVLAGSKLAKQQDEGYRYAGNQVEKNKSRAARRTKTPELGFLKIRYKAPQETSSQLLTFPLFVSKIKHSADEASIDFRFATAVAGFAEILKNGNYQGSFSLEAIIKVAQNALGKDTHGYRREFVELAKNAYSIKR